MKTDYMIVIIAIIAFPVFGYIVASLFNYFMLGNCNFENASDDALRACNSMQHAAIIMMPLLLGLFGIMSFVPVLKELKNTGKRLRDL